MGWFSASLHITAEDLIPAEVTRILLVEPTESQTNGVPILRENGSIKRVPNFGRWSISLKPQHTDEWDLNVVIADLLDRLPKTLEIWREVERRGSLHISLGLTLAGSNQEFRLESRLLHFLGERGISVYFDVYTEDT